jgi:LPS O-antigen subunit length determinant protein (WzzB/FepE family)
LNDRLRERALEEAENNVAYLREEMAKSSLVTMQQSIGQLLQSELQKLMLARGNEEFAFKVVDPAIAPKQRERPKRSMIAIIGTFLGGLVGAFVVLVAHSARSSSRA